MKNDLTSSRAGLKKMGNKALNLYLLCDLGYSVPAFIASHDFSIPKQQKQLNEWLSELEPSATGKWALAVRSSSSSEDGTEESKAGHFLSVLGEFTKHSLQDAIENVKNSGHDVSVIVQKMIKPQYSGVLFSCDPISFDRRATKIAWTRGIGEQLLSGSDTGEMVGLNGLNEIIDGQWPASISNLEHLTSAATKLEREIGCPVDIEWAIDANQKVWFLQVRPVVLPQSRTIELRSSDAFDDLPAVVMRHHKIRLRKKAAELGIMMSSASVITARDPAPLERGINIGVAEAASVVLLHPEHIRCKVIREFAPTRGDGAKRWTERCRRYSIRRYPKVEDISSAIKSVALAGLGQSWFSAVLTQAVWNAEATGIIRRTESGYIIDIAQGHFVPKGVVEVSTVILNREHEVTMIDWREQSVCYHFVDGHVLTETPPKSQLKYNNDIFQLIADTLDPLFDEYDDAALEFGIIDSGEEKLVYLIDVAEGDSGSVALNSELISTGVISAGKCSGKIKFVDEGTGDAIDKHLHDKRIKIIEETEPLILVAEFPSTELLSHSCFPRVAGFIFRKGSILAHLPVVLREKNIPAIVLENLDDYKDLRNGLQVTIDASSQLATARERITIASITK